jgi:hypothetical protein
MNSVNGVGDFISSTVAGVLWTAASFAAAFAYGAVLAAGAIVLLLNTRRQGSE